MDFPQKYNHSFLRFVNINIYLHRPNYTFNQTLLIMKFIKNILFLWLLVLTCPTLNAQFIYPMAVPDTLSGTQFDLYMQNGSKEFFPGVLTTNTMGINGDYLGPTLIFQKGDYVNINVHNQLTDLETGEPQKTTMHWHGMHIPAKMDGGPHNIIDTNSVWSPEFEIKDVATMMWYHPHLHHKTAEQVYHGLAAMIIIRDSAEATLDLPRSYGVDDFPLVLQDKYWDADGQLALGPETSGPPQLCYDTIVVNGTPFPYLEVPPQVIRFRVLNGANERTFRVGMDAGNMFQIGTDGGLLEQTNETGRLNVSNGERVQFLVDLTGKEGQTLYLQNYAGELPSDVPGGPSGGGVCDTTRCSTCTGVTSVLELRVGNTPTANAVTTPPSELLPYVTWDEADANVIRLKKLTDTNGGFPFYIDDTPFVMDRIDDIVRLDDIEIWSITNETDVAHPFHIHDINFLILDRNGMPPPPEERGHKDVVLVYPDETVRFITQFPDYADPNYPYMYHCHILAHEDAGMMLQFVVIDPDLTNTEEVYGTGDMPLKLFPNPARNTLNVALELPQAENLKLSIFDPFGKLILEREYPEIVNLQDELDVSQLSGGTYFISIKGEQMNYNGKFVRL